MFDLAVRSPRWPSRRGRLLFGRGVGRVESWLAGLRHVPLRYALHLVALVVGLGALASASTPPTGWVTQRSSQPSTVGLSLQAEPVVPSVIPTAETSAAPSERPSKPISYAVRPGDTLQSIAERFSISIQTLLWNNRLEDPDLIRPDQELLVLPVSGVLHTVRTGETLRQIAARYRVGLDELVRYNGVEDADYLVEGTKLVVPGGQPLVTAVARAAAQREAGAGTQVVALAELSPIPGSARPPVRSFPRAVEYEVNPGDTLNFLTQLFGIDLETILNSNEVADANTIKVGTKLRILPVSGLEHEVEKGETLADLAALYEVDLGPILDFNDLADPDLIRVGMKLIVPGAKKPAPAPAPAAAPLGPALVPRRLPPPPPPVTGKGSAIAKNALAFEGYPYVWGGTSPGGFDCSGFVWYVYKISGNPVSRGLWGQLNAGPRVPWEHLRPGDIVFFANTYMPGLSHNGIYIGGGQFIHASDPSRGVVVSGLSSPYWASRYVGASRP